MHFLPLLLQASVGAVAAEATAVVVDPPPKPVWPNAGCPKPGLRGRNVDAVEAAGAAGTPNAGVPKVNVAIVDIRLPRIEVTDGAPNVDVEGWVRLPNADAAEGAPNADDHGGATKAGVREGANVRNPDAGAGPLSSDYRLTVSKTRLTLYGVEWTSMRGLGWMSLVLFEGVFAIHAESILRFLVVEVQGQGQEHNKSERVLDSTGAMPPSQPRNQPRFSQFETGRRLPLNHYVNLFIAILKDEKCIDISGENLTRRIESWIFPGTSSRRSNATSGIYSSHRPRRDSGILAERSVGKGLQSLLPGIYPSAIRYGEIMRYLHRIASRAQDKANQPMLLPNAVKGLISHEENDRLSFQKLQAAPEYTLIVPLANLYHSSIVPALLTCQKGSSDPSQPSNENSGLNYGSLSPEICIGETKDSYEWTRYEEGGGGPARRRDGSLAISKATEL
ncbi:hypothetical protein BKA70DRAFT_1396025 [Coprinopsis sp. MPI-PUGE-AT-0042]|nr:hypothetical protein BKA70DRAFT_1396025 [Coprinopsis sp. MPI-PUGE-AT-0042]